MTATTTDTPSDTATKATVPARTDERRLARWDPVEMMREFQEEIARWWGRGWPFWQTRWERPLHRQLPALTAWAPQMDAYEKDDQLIIKAELPGVGKDDVKVSVDRGDLLIEGERKTESEVKDEDYYCCERSYGGFFRRLPLPFDVQAEHIAATFTDGVLEIRMPKPAGAKPTAQRIPIS
jgi:HSP20 family protein